MPGGRPTSYKPEMCDIAIELMAKGASKVEVCAAIGISKETLYQWCNPESDYYNKAFSDAIKTGMALCQAWWERVGREFMFNEDGKNGLNSAVWIFNMKNRFRDDWMDVHKSEITGNNGSPLNILLKQISESGKSSTQNHIKEKDWG